MSGKIELCARCRITGAGYLASEKNELIINDFTLGKVVLYLCDFHMLEFNAIEKQKEENWDKMRLHNEVIH